MMGIACKKEKEEGRAVDFYLRVIWREQSKVLEHSLVHQL